MDDGKQSELKDDDKKLNSTAPSSEDQQTSDKTQHAFAMQSSAVLSKMPNTIRTKEGISITLKKGSLAEEKADVLFNSTRNDLNLASGTLSSALLEEAGPRIQEECYNNKPSVFRPGDIVVTSGGNLQAKSVFHGFCRPWNGVQGKPDLKAIIRNALDEAHARNYESIAFPAIGTGNLQYPPDVVSEVIVEEVVLFSVNYPKTTLKDVRIVLYPGDQVAIEVFEDYWTSITELEEGAGLQTLRLKRDRYGAKERVEMGRNAPSSVQHCVLYENKDLIVGQIEVMTITVKKGDITKETTDVIMTSTDSTFTNGKVLRSLLKVGGQQIKDECDNFLKTEGPVKDVAMTNSGRLRCKKILHINVLTNDWNDLLLKAFKLVEEKGMQSLAMPAIGTGMLGIKASDVADIILKAVTWFAITHKPINFHRLVIVLYDRSVFKDFRTQTSSTLNGKQPDFFSKILGCVRRQESSNKTESVHSMTYRRYAFHLDAFKETIGRIEETCKEQIKRRVFLSNDEQKVIALMDDEQREEIKKLEGKYGVTIYIEDDVQGKCLTVEGLSRSLQPCSEEISKLLSKVQEEQKTKELINKLAHWQFDEGSGFQDYPKRINCILEKAYQNNEKKVTWDEPYGSVEVLFDEMKQRQSKNSSTAASVRRVLYKAVFQLPRTWSSMKPGEVLHLKPLGSHDKEYKGVARKFTPGKIRSIQRVQNPTLYQRYLLRKQQMNAANPGLENEKIMYHGTATDSLDNINTSGFNRSYCGKNATKYGDGVYFAVDPMYAAQPVFAHPDSSGNRHVYQARVLVGKSTIGTKGMKEPPHISDSSAKRYDSVTDATGNIVVIFYDEQAYPEYLITFK